MGLIEQSDDNKWLPKKSNKCTYPLLNVCWMLRNYLPESFLVARLIPDLCRFMLPIAHTLSERKNQERISIFVTSFFSIFLPLVDRHECKPEELPFQDNPYFTVDSKHK